MGSILSRRGGSLYRGLAVPFSAFVLVATLVLAGWISHWNRQESMRRLERMAATNAEFVDELRLPRSRVLARKLSTILGVKVGFRTVGGESRHAAGDDWPEGLDAALRSATGPAPVALRADGYDIAAAPCGDAGEFLVLVRETRSGLAAGVGGSVLAPAIVLTAACGGLAFLLAHRIVRPLGTLTAWLPNLRHDDRAAEPIPASVSGRGDEIGLLARSLEDTHRRLRREQERRRQSERLAALGRIATSLAHEIRNPIAAIRLHADILTRGAERADAESLALIRGEVARVGDLVNQWLFVVRPAPPQIGPHDLTALTRAVGRRLEAAMDHAGIRLTISASAPGRVACDRTRIEQVVRNLLVNAVQAMPEGGEVSAVIREEDEHVELTIRDAGAGFSDEALRRFGEPFFSEREGGMGIGLTLAREVVAAHRGSIDVFNPSAGGGVVRVRLPRAESSVPKSS